MVLCSLNKRKRGILCWLIPAGLALGLAWAFSPSPQPSLAAPAPTDPTSLEVIRLTRDHALAD